MRQGVIGSYARTGLAKAARGGFNHTPSMTMLGHAIRHAVQRAEVEPAEVEDVIAGCDLELRWRCCSGQCRGREDSSTLALRRLADGTPRERVVPENLLT